MSQIHHPIMGVTPIKQQHKLKCQKRINNSLQDSAAHVTLSMEMATQLFQMWWCTTIPSLVTKGLVVQKTSSGQSWTCLFLTRRMLRNLLDHYQSHLFLIFCDGCLSFYCSKCCCWSVQRHEWVKVFADAVIYRYIASYFTTLHIVMIIFVVVCFLLLLYARWHSTVL